MLVNESTLRAVVRKHLLKEVNFVPAWNRGKAADNFLNIDPDGDAEILDSMVWNQVIDGSYSPQQQIRHLYDYVTTQNFVPVYNAIIAILKKHASDLDTNENEIERLYGRGLQKSLTSATSAWTDPTELPVEVANITGLPVSPINTPTAATPTAATPTAATPAAATPTAAPGGAATQAPSATATSLYDSLSALINLLEQAGVKFDSTKLNDAKEQAKNEYLIVDVTASYLVDAINLSIDKTQFQKFATAYLKTCRIQGIYNTNLWASRYLDNSKLLTAGTAPTTPAAPSAAPAAVPSAKPKSKPASNWDSYVRMTKDGAVVQNAWMVNAAKFNKDTSYLSFVNWYRAQMNSNGGRHLSPSEIINLLQQPTPAAAAPVATPATPAAVAAQTPAAPVAAQTPQSNWWTDSLRNRSARAADRAARQNTRANRTDTRRANRKANK